MSELYTSLRFSPRKKRGPPSDGGATTTPKKLRTSASVPSKTATPSHSRTPKIELPDESTRILRIHNAIQQALSHALATCAISPSSDSGRISNVLNHISLKTYAGLMTSFELEDLKRLCWIWEWDGETPPEVNPTSRRKEDDNPFLEDSLSSEWTRGSMGFTVSLGSHYSKSERKRIPVYGVGIEVEMDLDKGMGGGMAAVARWTAAGETRRAEFVRKLEKWSKLHEGSDPLPPIPIIELPPLPATSKPSALTRTLASASPKSSAASQKFPITPASPSRSPAKKPQRDFALPFPVLGGRPQSPSKVGRLLFPHTPSKRNSVRDAALLATPQTPTTPSSSTTSSVPSTPAHHDDSDADSLPQTPTTSRRQALYERIRARSLSKSPTKLRDDDPSRTPMSRDQMLKLSQEEMRRRCLLERLPGIAESIWMLFSSSGTASSVTATPTRKRKAIPVADVLAVVIKSSPVPISNAEANESLNMLMQMCPFFLKKVVISSKEWLEMPSSGQGGAASGSVPSTPTKHHTSSTSTSSPTKGLSSAAHELLTRSPKAVRHPQGGLREVREILRREIELQLD